MIARIVTWAVEKRWLVLLLTVIVAAIGAFSLYRLPIDAVPDITQPQVQINTRVPALAPEVACVPYDVVNAAEAAALAAGRPRSLLHVDRAEIDLPPDTDPYSDAVYARARSNFESLQRSGALVRETGPCLYVYQQRMGDHVQRGLVAGCHVEDYDAELIKKHEKTRKDKEDDRTRHVDELGGNDEPVFLTYRARGAIDALMAEATRGAPEYDFTTEEIGRAHV